MVTIIIRDPSSRASLPSIVDFDYCAMRIGVNTRSATMHESSDPDDSNTTPHSHVTVGASRRMIDHRLEKMIPSPVNILRDTWSRFPQWTQLPDRTYHVLRNTRDLVDTPWVYQQFARYQIIKAQSRAPTATDVRDTCDQTSSPRTSLSSSPSLSRTMYEAANLFDAVCAPSIMRKVYDIERIQFTRFARVIPWFLADSPIYRDIPCTGRRRECGGLRICSSDGSRGPHIHVDTLDAIPSLCARFICSHIVDSRARDYETCARQEILSSASGFQSVVLLGSAYYMSMMPVARNEYDASLAPRTRLRVTTQVALDLGGMYWRYSAKGEAALRAMLRDSATQPKANSKEAEEDAAASQRGSAPPTTSQQSR